MDDDLDRRAEEVEKQAESVRAVGVRVTGTHVGAMYDCYDAGKDHAEDRLRELAKLIEDRIKQGPGGKEEEILGALSVVIDEGFCCEAHAAVRGTHSPNCHFAGRKVDPTDQF